VTSPAVPPTSAAAPSPGFPSTIPTAATPRSRPVEALPALDFTIGSVNVLGASHTSGRGARPGFATGAVRARRAAVLLRRHRADVIGFQELQTSQLTALRRLTDLDFYPGSSLGRLDSENSIGWRRDQWVAVETHTVDIPYFDGGARAMPYVRLRNRSTGLEAWFANFHNPAETGRFHHQQAYRTRATLIEARLANMLLTTTGLPVLVTGDMNERSAYFCRLTSRAPLVAARGGSNIGGRCQAGRPGQVDWIFGSQGVQFSDYAEDDSHLVDRTTDHPVVTARVRIQGNPAGGPTGGTTGG
jgi:endonuclease/exonuclease/phosphatase family metal-dependent hydrolase